MLVAASRSSRSSPVHNHTPLYVFIDWSAETGYKAHDRKNWRYRHLPASRPRTQGFDPAAIPSPPLRNRGGFRIPNSFGSFPELSGTRAMTATRGAKVAQFNRTAYPSHGHSSSPCPCGASELWIGCPAPSAEKRRGTSVPAFATSLRGLRPWLCDAAWTTQSPRGSCRATAALGCVPGSYPRA